VNLVVAFGREGDETALGVDDPAQQLLAGGPVGVPEAQFFYRVGCFAVPVVGVVGTEEQVKRVEDVASGLAQVAR
jgi:hypothetical protein